MSENQYTFGALKLSQPGQRSHGRGSSSAIARVQTSPMGLAVALPRRASQAFEGAFQMRGMSAPPQSALSTRLARMRARQRERQDSASGESQLMRFRSAQQRVARAAGTGRPSRSPRTVAEAEAILRQRGIKAGPATVEEAVAIARAHGIEPKPPVVHGIAQLNDKVVLFRVQ